jgi:ribose 1,5-bisphosphokinase PhnN
MKEKKFNELVNLIDQLTTAYIQNKRMIRDLEYVDSVAVVGSSCTGKTRLVDAVRNNKDCIDANIKVPLRFISRPKRNSDRRTTENCHLARQDFLSKVENGEMQFSWTRNMEGDRTELYGFERVEKANIIVYSSNNAIFNNAESLQPKDKLSNTLILGVYAPEDVIKIRMKEKLQDIAKLNPSEITYRLSDKTINIFPYVHIVTHNYHKHEQYAESEFVQFIIKLERIFSK